MKRLFLFLLILLAMSSWSSSACSKEKTILGRSGAKTTVRQSDFASGGRTYVFKGVCSLSGQSIYIPENSILDLRNGEIMGGSIVLAEGVLIKGGHTKNLNVSTKGFFANSTIYIDNPQYAATHIQSASSNVKILCDIDFTTRTSGVSVCSNLDGNGHKIRIAGESYDLLYLNKDGVTIKNVILENKTTNPKSDCRVILCKASNITIDNCTLRGAMVFAPENGLHTPLRNILIENSVIDCDFSTLSQGYNFQHDVLTFRACKDVSILNNVIRARDVNRVFKTARGWTVAQGVSQSDKSLPCVENIIIQDNDIVSDASCGKQFWDMYNGTINPQFINNRVKCLGHTVMFENKTKDDNGAKSVALIEKNTIETDWKLFFLNSNKANDAYVIRNNSVIVSGDEREHIDLAGQKKNRNYVNSMAGFSSVVFENNTISGKDAGEGLYPFIFQLESGDVCVHNNSFFHLGPTLIVDSANIKSLEFVTNEYLVVDGFDCELSVSGNVDRIVYKNSNGNKDSAVKMTKAAYEASRDIEIDAPQSGIQLKVKQGASFSKYHGNRFKKQGQEVNE